MFNEIQEFIGLGTWADNIDFQRMFTELVHHWFLFLMLGVIYSGMAAMIGKGLGLKNVFHDDPDMFEENKDKGWHVNRNSPALWSQFAFVLLITLVWGMAHSLGKNDEESVPLAQVWPMTGWAIVLFSLLSLGLMAVGRPKSGARQPGDLARAVIGIVLGLIFAVLLTFVASKVEGILQGYVNAPTYALVLLGLALWAIIAIQNRIMPCVALINLLSALCFVYAVITTFYDVGHIVGIALLLVIFIFANGGLARIAGLERRLKFDFEGIVGADGQSLYPNNRNLDLKNRYQTLGMGQKTEAERQEDKVCLAKWRGWQYPVALEKQAIPKVSDDQIKADDAKAETGTNLVDPLEALRNWRAQYPAGREHNPKLVLVATSGGAYRASFWTGLVLDQLVRMDASGILPKFAANVRLITGASGGMVTAAYFASMMNRGVTHPSSIVEQLEEDILASQRKTPGNDFSHQTLFPVPRDSLSPVAQQLVQRDLLSLFWPWPKKNDRGKVLERQWRTLDRPFSALAEGERKGWRPSLLFSPMIVESGSPLLISNLDVEKLLQEPNVPNPADRADIEDADYEANLPKPNSERVVFFDWFENSQETFKVRTAVRMNASFPYVSPSTALPTIPYRRVVDAGYYDNYGIDLAVNYLAEPEIRDWVIQNTAGIAVIEIRAFPFEQPNTPVSGAKQSLQWLTTPLDGMLAARGSTMTFRNWQSFRTLQQTYSLALKAEELPYTGSNFLQRFPFELGTDTSMNWYLPEFELAEMVTKLHAGRNGKEFARLEEFWG